MLMLWFLLGCNFLPESTPTEETPYCDPRELSPEEIRLRPLMCGDDDIAGGGIRRGDWILENNRIRIGLREIGTSLSTLEGSGGAIVDFALFDQKDSLLELLPYQEGVLDIENWEITETEEEISIQFLPLDAGIRLQTAQKQLQFWGDVQWLFRPLEGTERIGKELILPNQDYVLYLDGNIEDLGGDLLLSELNAIHIGSPITILSSAQSAPVNVYSNGDRLISYQEEEVLGFLPITRSPFDDGDGFAEGYILPGTTHFQAIKEGCVPSPLVEVQDSEMLLNVGECGSLLIRLLESGEERNGILRAAQDTHFIAKDGERIPIAQELVDTTIDAGFEFEPIEIRFVDPFENPFLEFQLQRALPETHSISLYNLISSDSEIRDSREKILLQNLGLQIDYALLSARNVVPLYKNPLPDHQREQIFFEEGLISIHDAGSFISFPWSSSQQPAFGAIRTDVLDFQSSIAMGMQKDRFLFLEYSGLEQLSPETLWNTPSFLWIRSAQEALNFAQSCGDHPYSRPVSDHIWLPHLTQDTPSKKEFENELRTGSLGLGNGPLLKITDISLQERSTILKIYLNGSSQNQPQKLALYSEQGEEKIWELSEFPFTQAIVLPERNVFCLVAWSDEIEETPWALSTPFYPSNL